MRIVHWTEKPDDKYFESISEEHNKEIMWTILKWPVGRTRWTGKTVLRPATKLFWIELRKQFDNDNCDCLIVIGRSRPKEKWAFEDVSKFRKGKAKISFNGTGYVTPDDLAEMRLAVIEGEAVFDYCVDVMAHAGKFAGKFER